MGKSLGRPTRGFSLQQSPWRQHRPPPRIFCYESCSRRSLPTSQSSLVGRGGACGPSKLAKRRADRQSESDGAAQGDVLVKNPCCVDEAAGLCGWQHRRCSELRVCRASDCHIYLGRLPSLLRSAQSAARGTTTVDARKPHGLLWTRCRPKRPQQLQK